MELLAVEGLALVGSRPAVHRLVSGSAGVLIEVEVGGAVEVVEEARADLEKARIPCRLLGMLAMARVEGLHPSASS